MKSLQQQPHISTAYLQTTFRYPWQRPSSLSLCRAHVNMLERQLRNMDSIQAQHSNSFSAPGFRN
jgi:hypothetical protein